MNGHDRLPDYSADDAAHRSAQEYLAGQPTRVAASAGPGGGISVAEAYWSGRLTAGSVYEWTRKYNEAPEDTAAWLEMLEPVLERPQPVIAAGTGYVSHYPRTAASPAQSDTGYRNAVEELRSSVPGAIAAAEASGAPAPELFPGWGDGPPPETASGLSPTMFAGLPWRAKLAGVWEPNRLEAFKLALRYAEPDGQLAAWAEFHGRGVVGDYELGVEHWAATASSADQPGGYTEDQHNALWPNEG